MVNKNLVGIFQWVGVDSNQFLGADSQVCPIFLFVFPKKNHWRILWCTSFVIKLIVLHHVASKIWYVNCFLICHVL